MKKAIAAFAAGKDRIEIKALSDDIATLDRIRDMPLEGYRKASENFKARESEQKNTAGEAVDSNYSIKDIVDDNGKEYNKAVVLDTNIFDGVKPRNWSKILTKHLVNNFAGKQFTVYDENGLEKTIEFARKKDRVKKDGANRSHIVLDKLSRKSDINSQLAVAHADEIIQVMKLENEAEEHSHQWLDENGWSYYKAILMQKNNKIFEVKINVAKARDGRNILYDINKIKEIGHGVVSSKSPKAQRDSHINPDFYKPILSQKDTSVNTNSLKNSSQSQELKNWFDDWRKNAVIYKDKLTASNNLDEIVLASTNYINEDLKHQRKDNIVEFARGEVLMQIGNNKYNAKVIVGLTKNNQMLLYDIVKFKKDIFKIKKEDAFTDQNVSKEVSRHYASSDKMISQNDSYVNNNYMQNSRGDASAKKAPIWFTSRGLQLPKLVQTIIDANKKIPQDDSIVNTNSMQNSQEDAPKKIESRKDVDDSVQSQEFKNWFGDWQNDSENASKVVNVDGTPKIMYHGSQNSFTAFDKKKAKSSGLYGKGLY